MKVGLATNYDRVLCQEWRVREIGGVRQLYTLSHDRVCIIDPVESGLVAHHLSERVEYKACAESDLPMIFTRLHVTSHKCCRFDFAILNSLSRPLPSSTSFRHDAPNDPYFKTKSTSSRLSWNATSAPG